MNDTQEHEYRHRTPDLWEVGALWALGFSAIDTEVDDARHVTFVFPDLGDGVLDAVKSYRAGTLMVNAPAMRQGYLHARGLLRAGLDDAPQRSR